MAKQDPKQKAVVGRVMHEFGEGKLAGPGGKVRNPRQAIAIALSEAGASNRQSPAQNRRRLQQTEARETKAGPTRAQLYKQAQDEGIQGRSRMTKEQLQRAMARH